METGNCLVNLLPKCTFARFLLKFNPGWTRFSLLRRQFVSQFGRSVESLWFGRIFEADFEFEAIQVSSVGTFLHVWVDRV